MMATTSSTAETLINLEKMNVVDTLELATKALATHKAWMKRRTQVQQSPDTQNQIQKKQQLLLVGGQQDGRARPEKSERDTSWALGEPIQDGKF